MIIKEKDFDLKKEIKSFIKNKTNFSYLVIELNTKYEKKEQQKEFSNTFVLENKKVSKINLKNKKKHSKFLVKNLKNNKYKYCRFRQTYLVFNLLNTKYSNIEYLNNKDIQFLNTYIKNYFHLEKLDKLRFSRLRVKLKYLGLLAENE